MLVGSWNSTKISIKSLKNYVNYPVFAVLSLDDLSLAITLKINLQESDSLVVFDVFGRLAT